MKKILIILIIITLNIIIFSTNSTQKSQDIPVNVNVLPHIEIRPDSHGGVWRNLADYEDLKFSELFASNTEVRNNVPYNYSINPTDNNTIHAFYTNVLRVKANIRTELHAFFRLNNQDEDYHVLNDNFYRKEMILPPSNSYVGDFLNSTEGQPSGMVAFLSYIGYRTGNICTNGAGGLPLNLGTTEYQEGSQETLLVRSCSNYNNTETQYTFGFYLKFGEEDTFALKAGEITIGWFEIIVTPIIN